MYSFRHTGAIEIYKRTGSLSKLQKAMGHSSLKVSLTYLRGLEVEDLKEEDMPLAEKIVKTVKSTGAVVTGPIPLPTHKKLFTVLRSPHVNKKSREQFQLSSYKRLLDIYSTSSKTIDALMKLELPSGVEVEIKV